MIIIYQAVDMLLSAKHIYMVGSRGSYSVAFFLYRSLGRLLGNCDMISSDTGDIAEKIVRIKEGDVLMAISMPRFLNNAVSVASCAKAQGAKVISISSGLSSPLKECSDLMISVPGQSGSYFRTLIPAMMVAEIIVGIVAYMNPDVAEERLKQIENLENDKSLNF